MADATLSGGTVSIPVEPGTTGFGKKLEAGVAAESGGLAGLGKNLGLKLLAGFAVVEIGKKIGEFISDGFAEYDAAAAINAQLAAGIKSTGNAANLSVKSLDGLASSIASYSGQSYASIGATEQVLQTFQNIKNVGVNKVFDDATTAAANMAAKLGGDASSQAIKLGKALNDPIQGLSALGRSGVQFTSAQKAQVTAMEKAGNLAGAQSIILDVLKEKFGGAAEAAGQTLPGAMARLQVAQGELAKKFVSVLAPSLTKGLDSLIKLLDKLSSSKQFQTFLSDLGSEFAKIAPSVEKIIPSLGEAVLKLLPSLLQVVLALLPAIPSLVKALVELTPVFVVIAQTIAWLITNLSVVPIVNFFSTLIDDLAKGSSLLKIFSDVLAGVPAGLRPFVAGVADLMDSVVNGIIDGINGVNKAIASIINPIASLLHIPKITIETIGHIDAAGAFAASGSTSSGKASKGSSSIKSFANGGTVMPAPGGQIVRVAEAGRAETILDTADLNAAMKQRGGHVFNIFEATNGIALGQQVLNRLNASGAV